MKLNIRHSAKAIMEFSKDTNYEKMTNLLNIKWGSRLTVSNVGKSCLVCGSTKDIEMHHIRGVAEVRNKMRSGKGNYAI